MYQRMMDDILKQIKSGEVSGVQFKERILDKYDIACELVAFSNSHGGKLVVGIKDKTGGTNALSYSEVQETTNLLSDIASENVVPSILINVETVAVEDGCLVVATIKEGVNKPYHDNKGIVWVKNGSDKRKVFDNAELAEMMTDCGSFAPDEAGVRDATVNDLDATTIKLDNRVEIHSPGALPNGLTIDDIKAGTSMPRNMFLFNNAIYLLPYTGVGSGITRALDEDINVTFMNNNKAQEFVITVWRGESNEVGNEVHDKSNQVEDLDTGLRYSNTDLDTSENDLDTGLRHSDTDLDTQLRHSDTPKVSLSNKQRDIVNFCSVPRTTKEILDRIGVSMHSKNRERYITSLVAAGYLQMTNPDNPTASNQKYKKVNIR